MKRWFLICAITLSSSLFAQTFLNGISPYEHLNKEYYIGALYLPEAQSDPNKILSDNRAQKMVIKVTAKRLSTRKYTQFWREGLALNNDLGSDVTLTNQISEFIRLPQESLTIGDQISISYTPVNGTEISLNNEILFTASGKSFFNALLNAWIGEVPHSRIFQRQILGNEVDLGTSMDSRLARFENTNIASDRVGLVSGWKAAEKAIELALAQAEEELRLEKEREEAARRKAAADKKRREDERKAAQLAAEKARLEAELAKEKEQTSEEIEIALQAQREAERKAAELERALESEEERNQREAIAAQYVRDKYLWEVLRDVYKRVSYPEWARQFEQEGIVTVNFLVGNQGQLLGISSVTPADAGLLGQELRDAVNRAAPFNAFPSQITDRQLRVTVDYEFTLADRVAELPEAPEAPADYEGDLGLTAVQKAVAWAKYKESLVAQLESSIEYPFWAQDLKQEGLVSAEVTVRNDGTISNVKLDQRSRHKILNQEVEQAMDRVGSVEPFPSWVEDDILTVLIEHNFEL